MGRDKKNRDGAKGAGGKGGGGRKIVILPISTSTQMPNQKTI